MKTYGKTKIFENTWNDYMFKIMKYYKNIIWLLLATNLICLITVAYLCVEINLLQEKLLEMTDNFRALEAKMSRIESSYNNEYIRGDKMLEKNNGNIHILNGAIIIVSVIALIYFGGVDPRNLGKSLNPIIVSI